MRGPVKDIFLQAGFQKYPAYIRFMWKADLVESWIATKNRVLAEEKFNTESCPAQVLVKRFKRLAKDIDDFEADGLHLLVELRCEVAESNHFLLSNVLERYEGILKNWQALRTSLNSRAALLSDLTEPQVREGFLSKYASKLRSVTRSLKL